MVDTEKAGEVTKELADVLEAIWYPAVAGEEPMKYWLTSDLLNAMQAALRKAGRLG